MLYTDLDHVRFHKRFLLRAVQWQDQDESNGLLLKDDELVEAEQWLTSSLGKEPLPTELHKDFIQRSRQAAQKRQRLLFSGVIGALVISIILSFLSFIGFSIATENANVASTAQFEAIANANVASTAQFEAIANANAASTAQFEAIENENIAHAAQEIAEQRAREADIRLLANRLGDIALSDPFLAYRLGIGLLEIEDLPLQSKGEVTEVLLETGALMSFNYYMTDLEVSVDRSKIYISTDNQIVIIDSVSGDVLFTLEHEDYITAFTFRYDDTLLFSADVTGWLYI